MYSIVYSFEIKPEEEDQFINGWKGLTQLFKVHANSLGSRLHKSSGNQYFAYAQWPDKITFENASNLLPEEATQYREQMRTSLQNSEVIFSGNVQIDLLD